MHQHASSTTPILDASLWSELQTTLDPVVLAAPQIQWHQLESRTVRYLLRVVIEKPWFHHLALLAGVLTCYALLDLWSVRQYIESVHVRWHALFPSYGLLTVGDWDPVIHCSRYMNDQPLGDSLNTRQTFLRNYNASVTYSQAYLRSLLDAQQTLYQTWTLPALPIEVYRRLSRTTELVEMQRQQRKTETDALAPHLASLRAEAHLRWNALSRLRVKFREAQALVASGQASLPLPFSYEDTQTRCRLHFVLWDQTSFVQAQSERGPQDQPEQITWGQLPLQSYFLEFVRTEQERPEPALKPEADAHGLLWFGDLLRYRLLRHRLIDADQEEGKQQLAYLRSWGYEINEQTKGASPFFVGTSGILTWTREEQNFIRYAQVRAKGIFVPVEALFVAATFGLVALDVVTTTGARMSELQQVSLTPECLHTIEVAGRQRLLLRLVPKGSDILADYFVGSETRRIFEQVATLLKEHYCLKEGEPLPRVIFDPRNGRAHHFPARPYLFQYNQRHLPGAEITACLRFLCHGMVFQAANQHPVVLKAHSLRHVFATHLHQVEQVPLDVVAVLLHQKNLQVTSYYAAPTRQQVVDSADSLLDRFTTHLGSLEEAVIRAPEDVQRQLVEAQQQVGTLTHVPGGVCTCHAICPVAFACTGCVFKAPDPTRREDIVDQRRWAVVWLKRSEARQLGPEIVKMRALIQRCDTELEEMRLIESYRGDEHYDPKLTIEPNA